VLLSAACQKALLEWLLICCELTLAESVQQQLLSLGHVEQQNDVLQCHCVHMFSRNVKHCRGLLTPGAAGCPACVAAAQRPARLTMIACAGAQPLPPA
jgi:hypothetical protein